MTIRHVILGLLAQQPRHGYELHAAFQAISGGQESWDVKPAQIYTTLARLEEGGLVVQEGTGQDGGPEKYIYALTETGLVELRSWLLSSIPSDAQRDAFYIKLMICLALGEVNPRTIIQIQRSSRYQELHRITAQRQAADPHSELARILFLDKVVMHLEADLRWLDMIEARLDDVQQQPLPQPERRPRGRPPKQLLSN